MQHQFTRELRTVNMFKRQRDITPSTSDDEEYQPKLLDYSDTESSDGEDNIRPHQGKEDLW